MREVHAGGRMQQGANATPCDGDGRQQEGRLTCSSCFWSFEALPDVTACGRMRCCRADGILGDERMEACHDDRPPDRRHLLHSAPQWLLQAARSDYGHAVPQQSDWGVAWAGAGGDVCNKVRHVRWMISLPARSLSSSARSADTSYVTGPLSSACRRTHHESCPEVSW